MSHSRLWTKAFIISCSLNFLITFVMYLYFVVISLYAVEKLNATISQAGLASGILIIGALLGRFFIGRWIDTIERKNTLLIGLILNTLALAFYLIQYNTLFLLIIRFLNGIVFGIASTVVATIAAEVIPETRKGEGIGFFSMSTIISTALGPFIGFYMIQNSSYEMIFSLCLTLGFISVLIALFVNGSMLEVNKEKSDEDGFKLSNYIELDVVPIAIIVLIIGFCFSSVLTFINFYAIEKNFVQSASFFFVIYSIAILISRPFTGRLMDLKGANFIMYPGFILFTVGLLLLSAAHNGFTLLLSSFFIGLGFGNLQSCTQAIAIKIVAPHRVGLATSTFFVFLDIGLGFSPYLLGYIIPFLSYSKLYMLIGFIVLISSALYFILHGKKEAAREKATSLHL